MNLTEYLVDYLKHVGHVEIPQVGVLEMNETNAFFDKATSTFFPRRRTIAITDSHIADNGFIQYIANRECVGINTAQQLWRNFTDAVNDKLKAEGSCHLNNFGTIVKNGESFSFQSDNGSLDEDSPLNMQPVTGVKIYDNDNDDPFLAYEQSFTAGTGTRA